MSCWIVLQRHRSACLLTVNVPVSNFDMALNFKMQDHNTIDSKLESLVFISIPVLRSWQNMTPFILYLICFSYSYLIIFYLDLLCSIGFGHCWIKYGRGYGRLGLNVGVLGVSSQQPNFRIAEALRRAFRLNPKPLLCDSARFGQPCIWSN